MSSRSDPINEDPKQRGDSPVPDKYQAVPIQDGEEQRIAIFNKENTREWVEATGSLDLEGWR